MRRFVVIVLMVLLPLQWSWSVAASFCDHAAATAHFGHHEHEHASSDSAATPADDGSARTADPASGQTGGHTDCHTCHLSTACVGPSLADRQRWPSDGPVASGTGVLPEPPVHAPYRPPLALVALEG